MYYPLEFRTAQISDIQKLVDLINSAYRQHQGNSWTSEVEIVTGDRINVEQLLQTLADDHFKLFVVEYAKETVACIGLTFHSSEVEIGTFCITPRIQNQGIGKQVLDFAESYIGDNLLLEYPDLKHFVMWVLSVRHELIAYYQRRGYQQTGRIEDYPLHANVGIPTVNLHLVEMKKDITHKICADQKHENPE
jgi:ribosomal protein S18 acetylase RimI-like enzyme